MSNKRRIAEVVLTLYVAFVFIQSLFFKFMGSPETTHIFGTLETWASSTFGFSGLFAPGGIFSANVVGSAELVASALLLAGLFLKKDILQLAGAVLGLGIISGAIFFHLFTPLGIVVVNEAAGVASDGGTLFIMASGVWISTAILAFMKRSALPVIGTNAEVAMQ